MTDLPDEPRVRLPADATDRELIQEGVNQTDLLVAEAKRLADQAAVLADDVSKASLNLNILQIARERERRGLKFMAAGVLTSLVLLLVGGVAFWTWTADGRQKASTDRAQTLDAVAALRTLTARVNDCVNEDGQCYKQQQSRTTDLLAPDGPVGELFILALSCAQTNRGDTAILACVRSKLAD